MVDNCKRLEEIIKIQGLYLKINRKFFKFLLKMKDIELTKCIYTINLILIDKMWKI